MNDRETPITELVDDFFSYKVNKVKRKIDNAVRRFKGDVVCSSDIIMADLLEPQFLMDSI